MRNFLKVGIGIMIVMLLATACAPTGAGTQPEATEAGVGAPATEDLPGTGATDIAPLVTDAMPTEAVATEPLAVETLAPAATTAVGGTTGEPCALTEEQSQQLVTMGENLYTTTCAGCHGPAGEGQADFPPLVGSAGLASEDPAELITTFLNPEVHPFITNLSQDDLAAVLSFARTTFGSQAAVCAQQIGAGMTQ